MTEKIGDNAQTLSPAECLGLLEAGGISRVVAGAAETGGAVALLDYRMPGHYQGPPAHVHPGFDEIFYVIEGTLTVRHGEEIQTAESGGTLVRLVRSVGVVFLAPGRACGGQNTGN